MKRASVGLLLVRDLENPVNRSEDAAHPRDQRLGFGQLKMTVEMAQLPAPRQCVFSSFFIFQIVESKNQWKGCGRFRRGPRRSRDRDCKTLLPRFARGSPSIPQGSRAATQCIDEF